MTDILVGQSYYLRFDPKLWRSMQPYPPLGSMLAASCVREAGYDVALFDSMLAESEDEWSATVAEVRPRIALLFEDNFNYLSKMCLLRMREAAFRMIGSAKRADAQVLVCGADATDNAAAYLAQGADFVLRGEGERTLLELLERLSGEDASASDVRGLIYLDDVENQIVTTPPRPVMADLDSLPRPAWDLIDVERYRSLWTRKHGYYSMNMATTRGCPYHCNWCAKPIWGQTYNSRSAADVAGELAWLQDEFRPDHIWFADDILALKPGWMASFADELESRETRVPFKCLSRVDLLLRRGEIDALARAGAESVWVGAESGSQKILDAMDKGTRVEQIDEACRRLHEASLSVGFFLQFGYPGETLADIELTLDMVRRCRPDEIGISVAYPLPGTRFFDMVRDELLDKQNWIDSEDLDMMFCGSFTTEFYRALYNVVHKELRAHQAGQRLLQCLRRPRLIRTDDWRTFAAAFYHRTTLPGARRKMSRASRQPTRSPPTLPSGMAPAEAAVPTPQSG